MSVATNRDLYHPIGTIVQIDPGDVLPGAEWDAKENALPADTLAEIYLQDCASVYVGFSGTYAGFCFAALKAQGQLERFLCGDFYLIPQAVANQMLAAYFPAETWEVLSPYYVEAANALAIPAAYQPADSIYDILSVTKLDEGMRYLAQIKLDESSYYRVRMLITEEEGAARFSAIDYSFTYQAPLPSLNGYTPYENSGEEFPLTLLDSAGEDPFSEAMLLRGARGLSDGYLHESFTGADALGWQPLISFFLRTVRNYIDISKYYNAQLGRYVFPEELVRAYLNEFLTFGDVKGYDFGLCELYDEKNGVFIVEASTEMSYYSMDMGNRDADMPLVIENFRVRDGVMTFDAVSENIGPSMSQNFIYHITAQQNGDTYRITSAEYEALDAAKAQ